MVKKRRIGIVLACGLVVATAAGATVTVFMFVNALWLSPPDVHDPARLVVVLQPSRYQDGSRWGPQALQDFAAIPVFEGVAGQIVARDGGRDLSVSIGFPSLAERPAILGITHTYFKVLGVPLIGRGIEAMDNLPAAPAAAVISRRLWQEGFGADPQVLGRQIAATPEPITIVGVVASDFRGLFRGETVDLWLPEAIMPRLASGVVDSSGPMPMIAIGRLRDGLTVAQATGAFRQAHAANGRQSDHLSLTAASRLFTAPDLPLVVAEDGGLLAIVGSLAALLLAAGAATLLALLLVHYDTRRRELMIRVALGDTPFGIAGRLVRQLAAIAAVGLGGALLVSVTVANNAPALILEGGVDLSRLSLVVDWRVLLVAAAAVLLVVGATGAVCIGHCLGTISHGVAGAKGASTTRSSTHLRRVVLFGHVSVTLALLVSAATCVRTFYLAAAKGPGFRTDSSLFLSVQTRSFRGWTAERRQIQAEQDSETARALLATLRAMPSVTAVSLGPAPIGLTPGGGIANQSPVETQDIALGARVAPVTVSPQYFAAIGTDFRQGGTGTPEQLVISESLAAALWPGQRPVGRWLRWGSVSGVVTGSVDIAYASIHLGRPAVIYQLNADGTLPSQLDQARLDITLSANAPDTLKENVRRAVREAFPGALSVTVRTGREIVDSDLSRERMAAIFLVGVSVSAWVLGVGSIFGLVSFVARTRRREFGVMLAIGASLTAITRSAMRYALEPVIGGVVFALCIALVAERWLAAVLVGIPPGNWLAYALPALAFLLAAVTAALAGAWKLRVLDPVDALREEV
ncbi:MAG: ABC transporter permease [Vicinamibacterales bacterium]